MAGNWSKGSGSSTMLILKLLTEKDMYGYEMIETLGERSNHVFDLKVERCIRCFTDWCRRSILRLTVRK